MSFAIRLNQWSSIRITCCEIAREKIKKKNDYIEEIMYCKSFSDTIYGSYKRKNEKRQFWERKNWECNILKVRENA